MEITKSHFGNLSDGREVSIYTMKADGLAVSVLDYGCTTQSLVVNDKSGNPTDVALGFNEAYGYETQDKYIGVTAGRYANRIAKGHFCLNGNEYKLACNDNGKNHLHGGSIGFDKRMWTGSIDGDTLKFSLVSEDGEEGYPGRVEVTATYSILGTTLSIVYEAKSDADTVIGLTNHTYYNLNGQGNGNILGHLLKLNSSSVVLTDSESIPTGELFATRNSCFDFTTEKPVGRDIADSMLEASMGYDHCFLIDNEQFCKLTGDKSGITLTMKTNKPAVQLYCGNFLGDTRGKSNYTKYSGLCLETEFLPDSPNQKGFSNCVLKRGETYNYRTDYSFSIV